jgi:hypothetical protein
MASGQRRLALTKHEKKKGKRKEVFHMPGQKKPKKQ